MAHADTSCASGGGGGGAESKSEFGNFLRSGIFGRDYTTSNGKKARQGDPAAAAFLGGLDKTTAKDRRRSGAVQKFQKGGGEGQPTPLQRGHPR